MAFNPTREREEGGKAIPVVKSNTSYRKNLKDSYETYCERVRTIASFYNWNAQDPDMLTNALNYKHYNSPKMQQRLADIEADMVQKQKESLLSIEEYRKDKPNSVVFQIVSSNNEVKNLGLEANSEAATPLYDGLVFRTIPIERSPFKSKENLTLILEDYEAKRLEKEKTLKAQIRASNKAKP